MKITTYHNLRVLSGYHFLSLVKLFSFHHAYIHSSVPADKMAPVLSEALSPRYELDRVPALETALHAPVPGRAGDSLVVVTRVNAMIAIGSAHVAKRKI